MVEKMCVLYSSFYGNSDNCKMISEKYWLCFCRSSVLNPDQMSAVRHIVAVRTGYTPPFVLFGPFGTGKTETIAQATMVLLKETKNTRILICAQSNRYNFMHTF